MNRLSRAIPVAVLVLAVATATVALTPPARTGAHGETDAATNGSGRIIEEPAARSAPSAHPLVVRLIDPSDDQPFQRQIDLSVASGPPPATRSFAVPTGKRLVIEYVSGVSVGAFVMPITIETTARGAVAVHNLNHEGHNYFGHPVRLFADPGTEVKTAFSPGPGPNNQFGPAHLSISGHLVDVP